MDQNLILENIKTKLTLVPHKPGCYQMLNDKNKIIYVGKAKDLHKRLRSYFSGSHDAKTTRMLMDVVTFEYIVANSEVEAFLLELNFIKEHRPQYNILLMDDKTYPYICFIDENHPKLVYTRDIKKFTRKTQNKVFGPFPDVKACKDLVEILNKVYPFRKCNQIPKKSCIYYDMKQCLAPCINDVKKEEYVPYIESVTKVLNGSDKELLIKLEQKMQDASENLEFEKAIEYRNIINSMNIIAEKQSIIINDGVSRDVLGYYESDGIVSIQLFHMRYGKIIERTCEVFDVYDNLNDVILSYIYQFYDSKTNVLPYELLIPFLDDYELISEIFNLRINIPVKGVKRKLVDLANQNAKESLEHAKSLRKIKLSKTKEPLIELANLINIDYPRVIELFDNSNIQGASAVSAMVSYIDGIPSKKDYRKYKVKTVEGADDYHTMIEVLTRRYKRLKEEQKKNYPDLIVVDGGKIQVKAALKVLKELEIDNINVIGLQKDSNHKTESIITSKLEEVKIDKKSNIFLLLESMQDEVHRFAITFFKNTHSKNSLTSILDDIKGIGKRRKLLLHNNFKSLNEMIEAPIEKYLSLGFPKDVAINLIETLKKNT